MSAKIETWEQFMDEAKKLGLVAPAAPADATVERVMGLADVYAERREYRGEARTEGERAALRAEVERIVGERDHRLAQSDYWQDRAEAAEADARRYREAADALEFVERWANHHAVKPTCTAEAALSCIQHYPPILEITRSYTDGKVPETYNPYAHIAALELVLKEARPLLKYWPWMLARIDALLPKEKQ